MRSVKEILAILSYLGLNPGCNVNDINKYILREFNPKKTTSAIYRSFNELKREGYIKKHSHLVSKFILTKKGWDFLTFYMNISPGNVIPYDYTDAAMYIRIEIIKRIFLIKKRFYLGAELESA